MGDETKFSVIVSMFEWIQKSKVSSKKRSKFRKFLDTFCDPRDYFSAIRLVLPSLDRERGSYGLKESVLASCLVDALGISKDSADAKRLFNWRKSNSSAAGNFSRVAWEVLQLRQGMSSGGLTIGELNDLLDRLSAAENRAEKSSILSALINKTNAKEMKWIIMIILKDLKLGISEKTIFHEFHPDAEDLFNVTCDLKLVCEKLKDRNQRHKRQDIEVGKAVRPQLAMRISDMHAAWKKLHGKEVVVECKFDGDRIQIHKNGAEVHYFSRNFLDHSEYAHGMSDVILKNVLADRCILDGEMLVWDSSLNRFAEFGSNQEIAKAAKEGLDSDRQLCYVAFDVLYIGDTSVIHQSLKERHELLCKLVKPVKGQLEVLLPDGSLNSRRLAGEPCWSIIAHTMDDAEKFFKETIENRDEGIVLKDLTSKWEPSDRSGKWLKLKPDYVHPGSDLDVLIIGGYYGSGRRGGEVAQFLLGLAEPYAPATHPRKFISFCRVGTGLSAEELDAVVTKLKPYFRKNEYPKKVPPSFYEVTNHSKERPDVWIGSPDKSIVLSITSDIRTIRSDVFAAPYSLRFPRIDRVRYDKPWHECLDVQSFVELVHASNGTTQKGNEDRELQDSKYTRRKSSRKTEKKSVSVVPSHFLQTDVSDIKGETLIFSNMMFYFVNVPSDHSLESLHRIVVENGGAFSMNLNNSVTHCIAAESKGIKYQAAKLCGDVIHYSWLMDCCSQKKLIPLQPKYFLFLSEPSRMKEDIDHFSDSYYFDLDLVDIKKLFENINLPADAYSAGHMKKKYYPEEKWCLFHSCCIYFHIAAVSLTPDWVSVLTFTMRRLKLEVLWGGGKVSNNLLSATHLVILSVPGSDLNFESLIERLGVAAKHLRNKRLHVVASQWLEDSLVRNRRLEEQMYNLKPNGFGESDKWSENMDDHVSDSGVAGSYKLPSEEEDSKAVFGDSREVTSSTGEAKRKRRPAGRNVKKGAVGIVQARRTRARTAKGAAKIHGGDSENSDGGNDNVIEERMGSSDRVVNKENIMLEQNDTAKEFKQMPIDKEEEHENSKQDENADKGPDVGIGEEYNANKSKKQEKLEVMVDPVHAMLMDMIPSLGKKTEEEDPKPIEKEVDPVNLLSYDKKTAAAGEEPSNMQPVKKKKVSYKDIANKLLQ